jgi:hypothetical protein
MARFETCAILSMKLLEGVQNRDKFDIASLRAMPQFEVF